MHQRLKQSIRVTAIIFGLMLSFYLGIRFERNKELMSYLGDTQPIRESDHSYEFIHPLLSYRIPSANMDSEFAQLRSNIDAFVQSEKQANSIQNFSLYFSELDKGRWIGLNEDDKFTPASLMKVAIMIAYYKRAENDPQFLDTALTYSSEVHSHVLRDTFASPTVLHVGEKYAINDLIKRMIIDSDNGAKQLLQESINASDLDHVFENLNMPVPTDDSYVISPRRYSLFFRVLFNGTYLTKDLSERALQLLSQTTFKDGIIAGLPEDTIVSHKFGEHVGGTDGLELHDCGIVYYKPSPYFICMMTRGQNLQDLEQTMSAVSKLIYDHVASNAP